MDFYELLLLNVNWWKKLILFKEKWNFTFQVFNRLREEAPEAFDKLQALTGDIVLDKAGLCSSQLQKVVTEVAFVFHCAANVRFQDEARYC